MKPTTTDLPGNYFHAPAGYDCPFCRLIHRELTPDSRNAYEDIVLQNEDVTAFISPTWWSHNPGHVLIVPNRHYENLYTLPPVLGGAIHAAAQQVALAMKVAYPCDGISTRQHNEPAGYQDVWHYHLHVFPRYTGDELYTNSDKRWTTAPERRPYAEKLRQALSDLPTDIS